jgi:hypothetical protein
MSFNDQEGSPFFFFFFFVLTRVITIVGFVARCSPLHSIVFFTYIHRQKNNRTRNPSYGFSKCNKVYPCSTNAAISVFTSQVR